MLSVTKDLTETISRHELRNAGGAGVHVRETRLVSSLREANHVCLLVRSQVRGESVYLVVSPH